MGGRIGGTSLRVRNADDSRSAGAWGRAEVPSSKGEAAIAEPAKQTPTQQLAVMAPSGQQGQPESPDPVECEACVAVMQSLLLIAAATAMTGA